MRIFFICMAIILFAKEINITSKEFFYDSKKEVSKFFGDVKVVRGDEKIVADEMILYFKNKKPVKFKAIGKVKFRLKLDTNTTYIGNCEELIYFIKKGDIFLKKRVFIKNIDTNESIKASEIKLNRFTKDLSVVGKPVNIIIKVNE